MIFLLTMREQLRSAAIPMVLTAAAILGASSCRHKAKAMLVVTEQPLQIRGECPETDKGCAVLSATSAAEFAERDYDAFTKSRFVTMRDGMRLRIASSDGRSAVYAFSRQRDGAFAIASPGRTSKKEKAAPGPLLSKVPEKAYFRLYLPKENDPADAKVSYLLASKTLGSLNEASGEFEEDRKSFCGRQDASTTCIPFAATDQVVPEIAVHVKRKLLYMPLGATVSDALREGGVPDPAAVAKKVRFSRMWDSHRVDVRFGEKKSAHPAAAELSLPLIAGDQIHY